MEKFQNKYRIASARAQWWDYGRNGLYFITICTANRKHYFGKIVNGKMILSPTGVIADILWHQIPNHNSFVELGDFVVMPNHIHGILILGKPDNICNEKRGGERDDQPHGIPDGVRDGERDDQRNVETLHATSLPPSIGTSPSTGTSPPIVHPSDRPHPFAKNEQMSAISPKPYSIPASIRSYKAAVTKHANRLGFENGWQERFHDHVIRNDVEYKRLSDYIINNPANWANDKLKTDK